MAVCFEGFVVIVCWRLMLLGHLVIISEQGGENMCDGKAEERHGKNGPTQITEQSGNRVTHDFCVDPFFDTRLVFSCLLSVDLCICEVIYVLVVF